MKNGYIMWRNSIFTRLIVTFLMVLIPFYFLGIHIFQWSKDMLSKEIFDSVNSQVGFYLKNLENDIVRIKKLQFDCIDDEDLNSLVNSVEYLSDYEKIKAITRLQQRLTSIKNSSGYIQNVSVYVSSISRIINSMGSSNGSIHEMTENEYVKLADFPVDSVSQINYRDNRLTMNAPFSDLYNKTIPLYFIEVELSKSAIKSALVQSNATNGSESMLISPAQKFVITSDKDENTSKDFQKLVRQYSEKNKNGAVTVGVQGKQYLLIYASSDYLGMTLARYIPEEVVFNPLKKYQVWFWAFSLLAAAIIVFYLFSIHKLIQKPLRELVKAFRKVENGDFDIKIIHGYKDEFSYLYTRFNEMIENLKTLIDQVYKQKILAQKAELKQLQSQIKPHFLYNSFFILQRRISRGDYNNAERFCEALGTYFKFITRSAHDEVTLAKEVEHARIYTEIQAMRFSNRLKVDFEELPADLENLMVPRLIMQPVIENAFEHGLEEKENNAVLRVSFRKEENLMKIIMEDNGDKLGDDELEKLRSILEENKEGIENTGIINIHKRICLAMGGNSGVCVSRGELGGLKVEIKLEIMEGQ